MPDSLTSEPGLRLILIGIAVLCAAMGFLRGLGRLVMTGLSLAAGAAAALAWYRYMPAACIHWWGRNPAEFISWGAIASGLFTVWFSRRFLHAVVRGGNPLSLTGSARMTGGILGFIPALLLLWGGALAVRWTGAAGHLRQIEEATKTGDPGPLDQTAVFDRLSLALRRGAVGDFLNRTDPLNAQESGTLGALLVLMNNPGVWERTVHHPLAGAVVVQPAFRRLRDDRDVLHALSFSHYSRLLALPEMDTALRDPGLRERLLGLDLETVLHEVISGRMSHGPPRAAVVPED